MEHWEKIFILLKSEPDLALFHIFVYSTNNSEQQNTLKFLEIAFQSLCPVQKSKQAKLSTEHIELIFTLENQRRRVFSTACVSWRPSLRSEVWSQEQLWCERPMHSTFVKSKLKEARSLIWC